MTPLMKYKSTVITLSTPAVKSFYLRFLFLSQAPPYLKLKSFTLNVLFQSLSICVSQTADMSLNYFSCPLRFQEFHCSIKMLRNSAQHSNTFMYSLHVQKVMYSVTQNQVHVK